MDVLISSNRSKERVEQSNKKLRDLIKEIRDLLTSKFITNSSANRSLESEITAGLFLMEQMRRQMLL